MSGHLKYVLAADMSLDERTLEATDALGPHGRKTCGPSGHMRYGTVVGERIISASVPE